MDQASLQSGIIPNISNVLMSESTSSCKPTCDFANEWYFHANTVDWSITDSELGSYPSPMVSSLDRKVSLWRKVILMQSADYRDGSNATAAEPKRNLKVPKGSRSGSGSMVVWKGSTSREVSSGYSARSFEVSTSVRRETGHGFQIDSSSDSTDRYAERKNDSDNDIRKPDSNMSHKSSNRAQIADYTKILNELSSLQDDWDGYDSKAPSEKALQNCKTLLDGWDWNLGISPELSVLAGGELSFELFSDDGKLLGVIDLYDDGAMSFALSIGGVGNESGLLALSSKEDRASLFKLIEKARNSK